MTEDQNSSKTSYINDWILILGQVLGWTPEQVLRWVDERFGKDLDDPLTLYYHRFPIDWAAQKIVPELFKSELPDGLDSLKLQHKISAAFWEEYRIGYLPHGTDLSAFRQRVEAILDEYRKNKAL